MYPVKQNYLTANRSHKPLKPQGIVLHSTATEGATDDAEVRYFNSNPDRQASAHAFVDWTASSTQYHTLREHGMPGQLLIVNS